MDKIKGIIFLLESLIKSGKKQWLTNNIVINKSEALSLINKLTDAIEDADKLAQNNTYQATEIDMTVHNSEVIDAKKQMLKMRQDANEYADNILSRLQLIVTKLQKNVIKIEKNISEGRRLIKERQMSHAKGDENEG